LALTKDFDIIHKFAWRLAMKKATFLLIFSVLAILVISSHASALTRGISVVSKNGQTLDLYNDYQALVVGIGDYKWWPNLPNAVNDAKEVAGKLKKIGFKVKLVLDPTSREMKTVLNELAYKTGNKENRAVLFYYAGHGETETLADKSKMGYIIPTDCPTIVHNPMGFASHAISMRDIESASLRMKAKHVLMLFDSCFSGSLFALVRAVPDDITEKSTLPVRQFITAGREDEQVPDKSMFKRCFLIGLDGHADLTGDGYVTGSELGMYLSDKVVNYTHRRQHPQYGKINNPDLDQGDFIFALMGSERKKAIAQVKQPVKTERSKKPQVDLDILLARIKEKQEAKKRAKEALAKEAKELREDLTKYKKIVNAKLDETIELAAWEILRMKYPEWTHNVNPGDTGTLVSRALAKDTDGTLRKIIEPPGGAAEQKRLASTRNNTVSQSKEIARDRWFIAYDDGTVLDTRTKLMWSTTDDGRAVMEQNIEAYRKNYRAGGYKTWRIPTFDELLTIYDRNVLNEYGNHVTKLIDITDGWVWGTNSSSLNGFTFVSGDEAECIKGDRGHGGTLGHLERDVACRVLLVRSVD